MMSLEVRQKTMADDSNVTPIRKPRTPRQAAADKLVRKKRDPTISRIREEEVLIAFINCVPQVVIAQRLGVTQPAVSKILQKALANRAKEDPEIQANARTLMQARFDSMLERWFPLAIGADGSPPSKDAAEVTLKILDRVVRINGLDTGPQVNVTVNTGAPTDAETMRQQIMASLDEAAERHNVIEGTLVRDQDAPA